jgi:Bacterial membrane protein YfhO
MQRNLTQNPVIHASAVVLGFCILYGLVFLPRFWHWPLNAMGDVFSYYIPVFYAPRSLWTQFLHAGFPAMADPQFQLWYPVNRLFGLFPHSWEYFIVSAYVLASSFTYGYLYRMTHSHLAAAMSGVVYGMSGFMVAYVGYSSMLHGLAWLPLLIWSLAELRQPNAGRWSVIGGIAIAGMVLAGHPQITVYGCGLGVLYCLIMGGRSPTGAGRYYRDCGLVLLFGLGLAAIQILPTFEFVQLSVRSQMSFEHFISSAVTWAQLVQLIFPYYIAPRSSGLGLMGYVGVMSISLAMIGFWTGADRRQAQFWLMVAGLNLLLGLGQETPLASVLYHVPLYNKFRAPVRHWFVLSFALSVLMGLGVVALQRQQVTRWLWRRVLGATVAIGAIGLSLVAVLGFPAQHGLSTIGLPLVILVIGLTSLGFGARSRTSQGARFWGLGLLCLVIVDGTAFNWLAYSKSAQYFSAYPPPSPTALTYQASLWGSHQRILPIRGVQGTYDRSLDDIPPDTSLLWRVPSASGYGPLILSRYSELLGIDELGVVAPPVLAPTDRTLDLLAVRYLFAPPLAPTARWRKQATLSANTLIYENANVLPRTWLVAETIPLNAAQILTTIRTSQLPDGRVYQPTQMALVEDPQVAFKAPAGLAPASAKILDLTDTRVTIQTQSTTAAFLVLSDVFYPGWQATIDGKPTPIYPTNYIQRGVQVPAGEHFVEYRFEPLSLRSGAGITLLSGGACAYRWWYWRRSRHAAIGTVQKFGH